MRPLEDISKYVTVKEVSEDGGLGVITIGKWSGSVIWSYGLGWEHVSVTPYKRHIVPTWDDMCRVKAIFFRDDEVAVQYHPRKDEYVNNMSNCLHLFRPTIVTMPEPPSFMVGVKPGQSRSDVMREVEAYREWFNAI